MADFIDEIQKRVLIFDGSKGYMLQKLGMQGGECPELWNSTHKDEVRKVYTSYKEAGADIIQTNTFQGNRIQLEKYSLGDRVYELNYEAVKMAKEVMGDKGFVAASIGPTGMLFEPSGDLTFDMAYNVFREQVKAVVDGGADVVNFETFTDLGELRTAVLAARDITSLPIICSMAFESNGRTLMGTDPFTAALVLKSLGVYMTGTNCSLGTDQSLEIIEKMGRMHGTYLFAKPNAGLPEMIDGKVLYKESAEKFAQIAPEFVKLGVRLFGGCCGTTPEFVAAIKKSVDGVAIPPIMQESHEKMIASSVSIADVDDIDNLNIGWINTASDKELADGLEHGDMDIVIEKALDIASGGYDAVYINIDSVNVDGHMLSNVVNIAQGYIKAPLIFKTARPESLEKAVRIYKGKAGVSVEGYNLEVTDKLIEIAKRYGCTIIDRDPK